MSYRIWGNYHHETNCPSRPFSVGTTNFLRAVWVWDMELVFMTMVTASRGDNEKTRYRENIKNIKLLINIR